jgi:histidine ammonia-lyase
MYLVVTIPIPAVLQAILKSTHHTHPPELMTTQNKTMKISCRVRGDWFHVPCKSPKLTVKWLGDEGLRRYLKLRPPSFVPNREEAVHEVRKTLGGAILDPEDLVEDVLDDNEFVSIVLETDRPNPNLSDMEVKFVTSQIPGGKFELPDVYMFLDGYSLSTDDLLQLGKGRYKIRLTKEAEEKVNGSRAVIDNIVKDNKVVYGITTGFGKFARTVIEKEKLKELQENLIRSHAAGVGRALSPEKTRMLLALRINVLSKGYSGISLGTLKQLIDAFNASCLSWVPGNMFVKFLHFLFSFKTKGFPYPSFHFSR